MGSTGNGISNADLRRPDRTPGSPPKSREAGFSTTNTCGFETRLSCAQGNALTIRTPRLTLAETQSCPLLSGLHSPAPKICGGPAPAGRIPLGETRDLPPLWRLSAPPPKGLVKQINRRRQRAAVSFGLLRPMRATGENTCFRGTPPPLLRWWRLATNTRRTFFFKRTCAVVMTYPNTRSPSMRWPRQISTSTYTPLSQRRSPAHDIPDETKHSQNTNTVARWLLRGVSKHLNSHKMRPRRLVCPNSCEGMTGLLLSSLSPACPVGHFRVVLFGEPRLTLPGFLHPNIPAFTGTELYPHSLAMQGFTSTDHTANPQANNVTLDAGSGHGTEPRCASLPGMSRPQLFSPRYANCHSHSSPTPLTAHPLPSELAHAMHVLRREDVGEQGSAQAESRGCRG